VDAEEHGVKVALVTAYKYLGKYAARLKVPRPSHAKKEPGAAETFKNQLAAKVRELNIEKDRPVRIWVSDEMRYGLQPVTRRVWSLRGERVVVPVEAHYEGATVTALWRLPVQGPGSFTAPR